MSALQCFQIPIEEQPASRDHCGLSTEASCVLQASAALVQKAIILRGSTGGKIHVAHVIDTPADSARQAQVLIPEDSHTTNV